MSKYSPKIDAYLYEEHDVRVVYCERNLSLNCVAKKVGYFIKNYGTFILFCFSVLGLLISTTVAFSQDAEPRAQVKAFDDWRVLCQQNEDGTLCQMLQSASVSQDYAESFLISISPQHTGKSSSAVVTVPLGVYLSSGIELQVDQRRPFKMLYEVCDGSGCHAGFQLSQNVLSAFRRGLRADVRVWVSKNQSVAFPVSLSGFSAAFDHYQSEISG